MSGRLVAVAGGRRRRPGAEAEQIGEARPEELEACPFCEGREDRTPPEVLAIAHGDRDPDTPGWRVRVVPNLYPAFEGQEVVVHSPEHVRSFAELGDAQVALVAEAWTLRIEATAGSAGYVHALINEGRAAGASLPHSHSQLHLLAEPPPAVRNEHQERLRELLQAATEQRLVVGSRQNLVAFAHPAGRLPYETLIASDTAEEGWPAPHRLAVALRLLRDVVRRLREVEGPVPWNAWLHHGSDWHIELLPRLTGLAGLELGAGIYINTMPPEEAAAALRGD